MVNIIENRCIVNGIVKKIEKHKTLKGFYCLTINLISCEEIENYNNLSIPDIEKDIIINIRENDQFLLNINTGDQISVKVKKTNLYTYFKIN